MRYEYKLLTFSNDTPSYQIEERLNQLGNLGWSLIQVVGEKYILRREKTDYSA